MCTTDASHCTNCTKTGLEQWLGLSSIRINLRLSMKNSMKMNSGSGGTRTVGLMYEVRNRLSCSSVPWLQVIGINSKDHQHLWIAPKACSISNFGVSDMDFHSANDRGRGCLLTNLHFDKVIAQPFRPAPLFYNFLPYLNVFTLEFCVSGFSTHGFQSLTDIEETVKALWRQPCGSKLKKSVFYFCSFPRHSPIVLPLFIDRFARVQVCRM